MNIPTYAGSITKPHGLSDAIKPAIKAKPNGIRIFELEKKVDALPEILRALLTIKLFSELLPITAPKYIEANVIKIENKITIEKFVI